MSYLRQKLPWLTDEEEERLRRQILARAARLYEQAGEPQNAAECWVDLGEHERAAALYAAAGQVQLAAETCLEGGLYVQALSHYQALGAELPEEATVEQLAAQLGQAACHQLGVEQEAPAEELSAATGDQLYRAARAQQTELQAESPLAAARSWAILGAYGDRVRRYDLVHEGYEKALRAYAAAEVAEERNETAQRYLATVREWDDRLLAEDIARRLADWTEAACQPGWQVQRAVIERYGFEENIHDVLHFSRREQWQAWQQMAEEEEAPEVDAYLSSLAPEGMVYIPPGVFLMGSADDDPEARDNEKPQHEVWLRGYYIDRTPVTNGKYRAFIEAGGYENEAYWTAAGWAYKERENWREPRYWNDERFQGESKPVVGVSWYEAVAYAKWAGKSLPAEAQWEKAAGWDAAARQKRRYPWGKEWDEDMADIYQPNRWPEVGQICPGESNYYGVSDMAGLYTWCTTKWNSSYPYDAEDGREDEGGSEARVSRGGGSRQEWKRCGFRVGSDPWYWYSYGGLRCVLPHVCVDPAAEF